MKEQIIKVKNKNIQFHEDLPHVNPGECQGIDPTEEHHTRSTYHPRKPLQEPKVSVVRQWTPFFLHSAPLNFNPDPITKKFNLTNHSQKIKSDECKYPQNIDH